MEDGELRLVGEKGFEGRVGRDQESARVIDVFEVGSSEVRSNGVGIERARGGEQRKDKSPEEEEDGGGGEGHGVEKRQMGLSFGSPLLILACFVRASCSRER